MNDPTILLTSAQVADLLGTSVRTVERLVRAKKLPPPLKLGRASRWRREQLVAALARLQADDTAADPAPAAAELVVQEEM
ncbi:MAG TPA: helix-turn-helix domain-containing protein [Tepidisphaeraceae bacterium]|nr:helix-turn-helix domain-containing protein [Tepidisphaeraceae bacterium]